MQAAIGVLGHPAAFGWQTLKAFRANQGLLLAGAVAYYALLSIVPLLIPKWLPNSRLDQCVTPRLFGGGVSVAATTLARSTLCLLYTSPSPRDS